jgi:hypothetical protein
MPPVTYTVSGDVTGTNAAGQQRKFFAGTQVAMSLAYEYGLTGAYDADAATITATSDGSGAGAISDEVEFATVASTDANNIVTLPPPVPNRVVALRNGATGYELRTTAPATVKINGGSGAAAESAIPANVLVVCVCDSATTWVCTQTATNGAATAVEVAAP